MRILVTGSEGTLGKPLVKELESRGHEVYGLDLKHSERKQYIRADVGNYRQLDRAINVSMPDVVYHLAAEFGRVNGEEYYDTLWQTNVVGTRNLLEIQKMDGFRVVLASSSEIYGDLEVEPLTEDLSLTTPLRQHNDYAISKWVNEQQCLNFRERFGNEIVRLRFFLVYGPGEYYSPYRSAICQFIYRTMKGLDFPIYDGYRTFLYIDDFTNTLANVCEKFRPGEVYNIGGYGKYSMREVSEIINECLGLTWGRGKILGPEKFNVPSKVPSIKKAVNELDHKVNIPLAAGIRRTIDWMKTVY